MSNIFKRNLALVAGFVLFNASSSNLAAEAKKSQKQADPNALEIALKLPQKTAALELDIQNADFLLKHEDREDIEIRVNNRQNWEVNDSGTVKQIKVARCPFGVYTTQNGGTYMGMGTVETPEGKASSIKITPSGIAINGRQLPVEKKVSKKDQVGLEMNCQGIFVNGHKVKTNNSPKGFDNQLDNIQVLVPNSYKGSLKLIWGGAINARLDGWSGDKLSVIATGSAAVSINNLKAPYELNTNKKGKINIDDLDAEQGIMEASNEGKIEIGHSKCPELDIKASDNAEITIGTGTSYNCNATAKGLSRVNLGTASDNDKFAFDASSVNLKSAGEAYINMYNSKIQDCKVCTADKGKIRTHGVIAHMEEEAGSCGNLTVEMKDN